MMKELIEAFPSHIETGIKIFESNKHTLPIKRIDNVVISGLGGSGIGGSIAADLCKNQSSIPVIVNKEYSCPAFVNDHTLFIASSYSGGTEETMMAVEEAKRKQAIIIGITSGGSLAKFLQENNYPIFSIPGGNPPRACLGYSLSILLKILSHYGLLTEKLNEQLEIAIDFLKDKQEGIIKQASEIATNLKDKRVIIYSDSSMEGVAVRFRQQLNENSKMLVWHHVVPEMNHNELVGWTKKDDDLAVVFLRNEHDFIRNQTRIEINKKIIADYTPHIIELFSEGSSVIEKVLFHIHLEDWISYFLSELNQVDIMDIKVIDYLKSELAKL